jgi:D-inositol-3-phosphate glycosyltransferase
VDRRVAMGLLFYPRGGSAQVALYLGKALDRSGWTTELLCGSLGPEGERTNAGTFFEGLNVHAAGYDAAIEAGENGEDPMDQPFPLHPSFEDREGAPDRVFAAVSPELGDHLVAAWAAFIDESLDGVEGVRIAHLHHLSPLQEAFSRARPGLPFVTHLHGTDLKMIDRIDRLTAVAGELGTDLAGMADRAEAGDLPSFDSLSGDDRDLAGEVRWAQWRHGAHWSARLRASAQRCDRFIVISPHDRDEAQRLLGVEGDRVAWIPNGVDTDLFDRIDLSADDRRERWRRWLVEDPQGWDESGEAGSIAYSDEDLDAFASEAPVLLFVGRFLDFKRVPLLVRAYAKARERFDQPAPLVIWGGFPGEWEGEHPHTVARELGVEGVFFAGWRGHDELAQGLAASDVMVAPSTNEPFGQVFLEAMAAGVTVIATRSGGPLSFVNTEEDAPNGWLVEPDDEEALADAMVEAVNDTDERTRRADNAYDQIRSAYAWSELAGRFIEEYEKAMAERE